MSVIWTLQFSSRLKLGKNKHRHVLGFYSPMFSIINTFFSWGVLVIKKAVVIIFKICLVLMCLAL